MQLESLNEKETQCDTMPEQESSLSAALYLERTSLRTTASTFQPAISNKEEVVIPQSPPKTSVMLRNIPVDFSRSAVMDALRSEGFVDRIVFVYVPMNLRSKGHFGYAFVDFD